MNNNFNYNKIISTYNKDGFVKVNKILDKDQLHSFKQEVDRICKILVKKYKAPYVNLTKDKKVNTAHNLNKIFPKSILSNIKSYPFFKIFLKRIFNDDFILRNVEIFAKPKSTGLAAPIHQDNYYWNVIDKKAVNVWISMNVANKSNGGLFYLKESHKLGLLEHQLSNVKGTSQEISKDILNKLLFKKISPSLNPGDCLIHHCEVIHGSNKNISKKDRTAVVLSFKAKNSKYDKNKLEIYKAKLNRILKKINY